MVASAEYEPPSDTTPFARQAAKASWVSFIFAYGFATIARELGGYYLLATPLFLLIGLALGIIALFGIRKYGRKGILIPAIIGIILNGIGLGGLIYGI